eukprot:6686550-Pyramimonas_sp.AAC.1
MGLGEHGEYDLITNPVCRRASGTLGAERPPRRAQPDRSARTPGRKRQISAKAWGPRDSITTRSPWHLFYSHARLYIKEPTSTSSSP